MQVEGAVTPEQGPHMPWCPSGPCPASPPQPHVPPGPRQPGGALGSGITLLSLALMQTWLWLYSLLKVCVSRRKHCGERRTVRQEVPSSTLLLLGFLLL